ncbi:TadE family type IV pilus minor pilin [Actinoplanes sp. NPDC049802]|uniref:TadE family type IV pilus minor pilin n=1 Tax=Actinoplanes sp. NPDC049802 TaxID=3154742 RepID=UPI0033E6C9B0
MRRRRWPGRDRGSFTAELAAGLPALMVLLSAGITAVTAVATRMQCLDAAREAALAAARGEPAGAAARTAPEGATVRVSGGGDSVTAEVSAPVRVFGTGLPGMTVRASAHAAREPDGPAIP